MSERPDFISKFEAGAKSANLPHADFESAPFNSLHLLPSVDAPGGFDITKVGGDSLYKSVFIPVDGNKVSGQPTQLFNIPERLTDKPILSPRPGKFDSIGAFNPAAVKLDDGSYVMLYRGQDERGISAIGFATSHDGIHFMPEDQPALAPSRPDELMGIEDPRVQKSIIEPGCYDMTATIFDGQNAQLALFRSDDLRHWNRVNIDWRPGNQGTWNVHWTKSGAMVPEKIDGKYWMYYMGDMPADQSPRTSEHYRKFEQTPHAAEIGNVPVKDNEMGLAYSEDGITWKDASSKPVLPTRPGMFDSRVVEPGPAPIITNDGILLLYNGGDDNLEYRTGWALFDKNDPSKLLARSSEPLFQPELPWEKQSGPGTVHQAPNVVFVEGMVQEGDHYNIYYGAADSHVGVASVKLVPVTGKPQK